MEKQWLKSNGICIWDTKWNRGIKRGENGERRKIGRTLVEIIFLSFPFSFLFFFFLPSLNNGRAKGHDRSKNLIATTI